MKGGFRETGSAINLRQKNCQAKAVALLPFSIRRILWHDCKNLARNRANPANTLNEDPAEEECPIRAKSPSIQGILLSLRLRSRAGSGSELGHPEVRFSVIESTGNTGHGIISVPNLTSRSGNILADRVSFQGEHDPACVRLAVENLFAWFNAHPHFLSTFGLLACRSSLPSHTMTQNDLYTRRWPRLFDEYRNSSRERRGQLRSLSDYNPSVITFPFGVLCDKCLCLSC